MITDKYLLIEKPHRYVGGRHRIYRFPCGNGLSLIDSSKAHAYPFAFEAAVLTDVAVDGSSFAITYDTSLTSEVEVLQTAEEANAFIERAAEYFAIQKENAMTKPTLYIIRGLPGSGKTTRAIQLQATLNNLGIQSYRCEADYWHYWDEDYQFMPELVPIAHTLCLNETKLYLLRGVTVIVSNTFTTKKEMEPYISFCKERSLNYEIIECGGDYGSIHNVPEHVINNMRDRWEKI